MQSFLAGHRANLAALSSLPVPDSPGAPQEADRLESHRQPGSPRPRADFGRPGRPRVQGAEGWVCPDKRRGSHPPAAYFIHPALLCTAGSRRRSASGTRVRATVSGCRHRTAKRYSAGACCRCSSSHPPPPLPPRSPQRSRPAACSSTLASGTPPRALSAPRAEPLICPSLPSHRRVGSSTAAATSHILAATVGGRSTRAPRRTTWLPCPPPQRGASPRE